MTIETHLHTTTSASIPLLEQMWRWCGYRSLKIENYFGKSNIFSTFALQLGIMEKVSIRFYNDQPVRAVWDEVASKWWFSVLDIVGAFNQQEDYNKNRNYWKYLKAKLQKGHFELVSATNQLTYESEHEMLIHGVDWEVLSPKWVREDIKRKTEKM